MKAVFTIALFILSLGFSNAQTNIWYNPDGVAIKGYDPVAYFTENAPVKGSKQFSYSWEGTEWNFKNQSNLDTFKANPEKYAPQFGGYCAYGASENHKAPTEADAFTIVNDKLYLNYNKKVKEMWIKDTKGRIETAEKNWVKLKDQKQ
jgi:YHS domain-containing protein